jgi:hypothetical protein
MTSQANCLFLVPLDRYHGAVGGLEDPLLLHFENSESKYCREQFNTFASKRQGICPLS